MKKNLTLILMLLLSINLYAERVDKSSAMKVANAMLGEVKLNEVTTRSYSNLYIFSNENSFVIISADDRTYPIIGYSYENPFAADAMTSNINYWLDKVNNEIQYVIDNNIEATVEIQNQWQELINGKQMTRGDRAIVEPLITTKWDQGSPYNEMCPGGCVTGCGATAMAQVLKYWEWPKVGIGQKNYFENDYGVIRVDFSNTMYDYDNMPDKPTANTPAEKRKAIATLMYHCGVSIEMDYGIDGSGALPSDMIEAMKTHFGYPNTSYASRNNMSDASWTNILKEELNNSRPVLYNGWDVDRMGHSFICDGYNENGYFHFNWGWGGYSDGYFTITDLNPGSGGIGSGSGNYNEDNFILTNVEPDYTIAEQIKLVIEADVYDPIIHLKWTSGNNVESYNIYRTDEDNNTTQIASNLTETVFDDTEIEYEQEYCYVIKGVIGGTESKQSNEKCTKAKPNTCVAPSNITAEVVKDDPNYNMKYKVTISWDKVSSANNYVVYINGNKFKETNETNIVLGNNKETTIDVAVKSLCNNYIESDLSETVTVEINDVSIEEFENRLEIFPNPVNDKLFINGVAAIEEINIYNITGVKVYHEEGRMNNEKYTIDVNNLQNGMYIIDVKTTNGNIVKRFTKE